MDKKGDMTGYEKYAIKGFNGLKKLNENYEVVDKALDLAEFYFEQSNKKSSKLKLLIAGFVVGVTNPKTIIFYLSFLPIFVDLNHLTTLTVIKVIAVIGVTVFCVLSLANILGIRLRRHIENPVFIKRINEVTGITMILVGIFVGLY